MHDLRVFVEATADAVPAEFAHDGKTFGFGVALDGMADVAEGRTGAHHADAAPHRFVGNVHQAAAENADVANEVGAVGVAVPAVFDDGDVYIDDVAVFQGFVRGDAVADDVIDRDAGRGREGRAAVVEAGGDGLLDVGDVVVTAAVQFGGADAGNDVRGNHVKHVRRQAPGDAHFGEVGLAFQGDGHGFLFGKNDGLWYKARAFLATKSHKRCFRRSGCLRVGAFARLEA